MGMGQRGISFVIGAVDKFSAPLASFNAKLAESTAGLRVLGSRMGNLGRESGLSRLVGAGAGVSRGFDNVAAAGMAFASQMALIGGGLGYGFKKGFVDVASQFEKFETILNTLNRGDTGKSKKEMSWISDFAAKTPYELAEVTEAFVKLRSYGLEPTNGLLETLGDSAAAQTKPLKMAVEAIADAVMGDNERLKESFSINAKKVGDKFVYSYTNSAGKQAKLMAKANDKLAIQAVITKILAEKYGGGMEALSKTYGGMMSNLSDAWARFAQKVMGNGAFDWMKGKLSGILSTIDEMAADGRLDAWAKRTGEGITTFLTRAWEAGKGFAGALMVIGAGLAWTANLLGGWENLGIAVAALMGMKLVVAVGQLTIAFAGLGLAVGKVALSSLVMLCSGLGSVAAMVGITTLAFAGWALAIAGIAAGIMLIWRNWDSIIGWIKDKTPQWILRMFGAEGGGAESGASGGQANTGGTRGLQLPALGTPALFDAPRPSLGAASVQQQINESRSSFTSTQQSKITVDFANTPKGTSIRNSGSPIDLGVDWSMGPAMAS